MGGVCTFSRFGKATTRALKFSRSISSQGSGVLALRHVARFEHHGVLVHLFLQRNFLADAAPGSEGMFTFCPVHADVAVQDDLPRLRARTGEAQRADGVVETPLEHDDEIFDPWGPCARSDFST